MALDITVLTGATLTATVEGNAILASIIASSATLNVEVGVPGPAGPQGPAGQNGQGVATGGTTGQALVKLSNADFATGWATINSAAWGNITGTLSNQTDLYSALNGKLSLTGGTMSGDIIISATASSFTLTPLGFTIYNDAGSIATFFGYNSSEAQLQLSDSNRANGTVLSSSGIQFNDLTQQTTAYIEAPIDGTTYGRKDGSWSAISSGGGTWGSITGTLSNQTDLQSALDAKLSLTGGSMSGDIIWPAVGTGSDSQIGTFGFGTENLTLGQTAYVEPQQIRIYDGDHLIGTSLNGTGITFNDETVQVTAYDPAVLNGYLPLTGGTLTGSLVLSTDVWQSGVQKTISGNAVDGYNYSGYNLESGGTDGNPKLVIYGGNTDDGYDFTAIIERGSLTFKDAVLDITRMIYGSSGITFPDSSVQTTAFIPADYLSTSAAYSTFLTQSNASSTYLTQSSAASTYFPKPTGTTSQYITGTGSLVTFPPLGDRYLTSSTTTLTVDSGNGKTMTVGTGLSYSPQQDITVSYNNANHMHGTVLSYNSTTGVMTWDSNTHSGSGTYSSWEVNVGGVAGAVLPVGGTAGQVLSKINSTNFNTEWVSLGSASTLASSAVLLTANNLSDLSSSSTARSNLGLGSMATQSTSAYLSTAAAASTYLSISSAASTYQTQAGMSAYLSTSAAASTYQTQAGMSAYLSTSAASSTYIAQSSFATTAQAEAMTSTTAVISPARFREAYFSANVNKPNTSTWTTGTSGTGGTNDSATWDNRRLQGPTSAANTYVRCDHGINQSRGRYWANNIDWTKYVAFSFRISQNALSPDSNSIFRAVLGEVNGTNTGDPTVRSVGIKFNANGVIKILAHDGTTLTTYSTSTSVAQNVSQDILIVSDGSGTVTVYSNGTSIGSTTGGPTTLLAGTAQQNNMNFRIENNNTPSGNQLSCVMSGITVYTS